jgi:hypothetical protein
LITETLIPNYGKDATASRVVSYLTKNGRDRAAICDEHLKSLYAALTKSTHTPLDAGIQAPLLQASDKPVEDAVWGVIVETREHAALENVVCQFSEKLNIGIQLFHGAANEKFIRASKISSLVDPGKVVLTSLQTEALPAAEYNALFLSTDFWNAQMGRKKILVFQTDAVLCTQSDYQLADFLDYDYIGSKWPRQRPVGMIIDGGSGGLSLRDWHRSVECLDRFSPDLWPGGEDGYFAFHIDLVGGKVGRADECARFSSQCEFLYKSFGAHKISEMDALSLERFTHYAPDSWASDL